jgi:hypothetical protein
MNFLKLLSHNKPRAGLSQAEVLGRIDEDLASIVGRNRMMGDVLQVGPNHVHAMIGRGPSGAFGKPGTFEDLGWAHNYRTTVGMDWLHRAMGGYIPAIVTLGTATSTSATSWVKTAAGFTSDAFKGMRVVVPVTGLTTEPVYGNIGTNDTTTLTIDQWWKADDTVGTTPGNSAGLLLPGMGPARFIAVTTDSGAAGDVTTLPTENNANGVTRALATFAHTGAATTYTLVKQWTATGTITAIHKAGNFTSGTLASVGIIVANTVLNADATLANQDTLQITWTWTLPANGA